MHVPVRVAGIVEGDTKYIFIASMPSPGHILLMIGVIEVRCLVIGSLTMDRAYVVSYNMTFDNHFTRSGESSLC